MTKHGVGGTQPNVTPASPFSRVRALSLDRTGAPMPGRDPLDGGITLDGGIVPSIAPIPAI